MIILAFVAVMATLGCAPAGALGVAIAALAVFNAAARRSRERGARYSQCLDSLTPRAANTPARELFEQRRIPSSSPAAELGAMVRAEG